MAECPSADLRRIVAERANGCCEYCRSQARFATQSFSVEHILPKSRGGQTVTENLAFSCQGCNNIKFTKIEASDPVSNSLVPLYHPRQAKWRDHFTWNDDYTLIIGLTPVGRATILALDLNRSELVNLRRVLFATGYHPPVEVE